MTTANRHSITRRAAIRTALARGERYWSSHGEPLHTEDEILDALERDDSVRSRTAVQALALAPMADVEDGEEPGLFPRFL